MTVIVSSSVTQPAIVMDKLHVESFTLKQAKENDPKRIISMGVCLYGFDENGDKVFSNENIGVEDKDFDATVVTDYITNGGTLESFMVEYVTARTAINTEFAAGNISDAELMAYFELALARIVELHGKTSVSGIE